MKARLPQGMGGGPQNMNAMIRQAQTMQEQMAALQDELNAREFTASAGGGMVTATVLGNRTVKAIEIKPEAVDPDDVEMLQDLVLAAVNEALHQAEQTSQAEMSKVTGGMPSVPGLF